MRVSPSSLADIGRAEKFPRCTTVTRARHRAPQAVAFLSHYTVAQLTISGSGDFRHPREHGQMHMSIWSLDNLDTAHRCPISFVLAERSQDVSRWTRNAHIGRFCLDLSSLLNVSNWPRLCTFSFQIAIIPTEQTGRLKTYDRRLTMFQLCQNTSAMYSARDQPAEAAGSIDVSCSPAVIGMKCNF